MRTDCIVDFILISRLLLEAYAATPPYSFIEPEETTPQGYTITSTNAGYYPTHAFALRLRDGTTVVYPVHGLVFAASCSFLEQLVPPAELMVSNRVILPVVPLNIPHPESFTFIRDYLYIKLEDTFYESIFAWRCNDNPPVGMHPGDMVIGLYRNGITLGIVDDQYWKILRRAWSNVVKLFMGGEQMFYDIKAVELFVKDYSQYLGKS